MIKSVLILDEFFAITAKIRTLFLSHIKITNYLTLKHGTFNLRQDLMDSIDTIIMGGKTYRAVLDMDFEWPYSDKACYIVSHRNTNLTPTKNVKFITENVVETVKALKQQDGKDIWLVGGGQVITLLLNHDLVDEMQICYIPVILGNGIPLFPNQPKESTWKFAGSEAYDSGIVKITYVIG